MSAWWGALGGMVATKSIHLVRGVRCCADLEFIFGIFGADSDLGAYRKVAVLRMLFYLY